MSCQLTVDNYRYLRPPYPISTVPNLYPDTTTTTTTVLVKQEHILHYSFPVAMPNNHLIPTDIRHLSLWCCSIVDTSNTSSLFSLFLSINPHCLWSLSSSLPYSSHHPQTIAMSWSTVEEMLGSLDTTTTTTPHQQQVNLWQHAMSSGKERSSSSTTGGSNKRKVIRGFFFIFISFMEGAISHGLTELIFFFLGKMQMGNAESCEDYYCSDVANIKKMKGGEQTVSSMNKKMKMKNNKSGKNEENCSEDWKNNFIHVRARRGQATDSHSLAERVSTEQLYIFYSFIQITIPFHSINSWLINKLVN